MEDGIESAHERIDALGTAGAPLKTLAEFAALTPTDGMEVTLLIDATAGIAWLVKYRAASSSAYKWEVIGPAVLVSQVNTAEATAVTTYTNLATVGPSIVLPRPGDYVIEHGFAASVANTQPMWMSYDIGGTGAVDADAVMATRPSDAASVMRSNLKAGLSNVTLTAKYKAPAAVSSQIEKRWMKAIPRRIS